MSVAKNIDNGSQRSFCSSIICIHYRTLIYYQPAFGLFVLNRSYINAVLNPNNQSRNFFSLSRIFLQSKQILLKPQIMEYK